MNGGESDRRGQVSEGLGRPGKGLTIYSNCKGKPLEVFKQGNELTRFTFLKCHVVKGAS